MKLVEKVKGLSKSKKIIVGSTVALAVTAIIGVGYTAYADNQAKQEVKAAQETINNENKVLIDIESNARKLLNKKNPEYLAENLDKKKLEAYNSSFDAVEKKYSSLNVNKKKLNEVEFQTNKKNAKELLDSVGNKLAAQEAVNLLYPKDKLALNGDKINKELPIIDGLATQTVEKTKKDHFKEKSNKPFEKTINELITVAESQLKQIDVAKQAVTKVFKDNKVISTDQKLYDTAKAESDKIKNEKAKKELLDQLTKVKTDIDKKVSEEKKKAEEANKVTEQAKAAEQNAEQQAQGNMANNNANSGAGGNEANTDGGYPAGNATGGGTNQGWQGGGSGNTGEEPSNPNAGGGSGPGNGSTGGGNNGGGQVDPPTNQHGPQCEQPGLYPSYAAAQAAGFEAGGDRIRVKAVYCEHGIIVGYTYVITG